MYCSFPTLRNARYSHLVGVAVYLVYEVSRLARCWREVEAVFSGLCCLGVHGMSRGKHTGVYDRARGEHGEDESQTRWVDRKRTWRAALPGLSEPSKQAIDVQNHALRSFAFREKLCVSSSFRTARADRTSPQWLVGHPVIADQKLSQHVEMFEQSRVGTCRFSLARDRIRPWYTRKNVLRYY